VLLLSLKHIQFLIVVSVLLLMKLFLLLLNNQNRCRGVVPRWASDVIGVRLNTVTTVKLFLK